MGGNWGCSRERKEVLWGCFLSIRNMSARSRGCSACLLSCVEADLPEGPRPSKVGLSTQWKLVDTKVKMRKGQGGVGRRLRKERDLRWAWFTCPFYSFLVLSNPPSLPSVLTRCCPSEKASAKIPSSDTQQLLRVARLPSLVDSWLRWPPHQQRRGLVHIVIDFILSVLTKR